jgi:phosphopentomutase
MEIKRAVLLILDSCGIGELPDAHLYKDEGSNTLVNTARAVGGLTLPHLQKLGLGNITEVPGVPKAENPLANFGKMKEKSKGKDSTIGHWEIAGVISENPFPVYPDGFPGEIINEFERRIKRKTLWNKPASGTEIIKKLGEEHMETKKPIVYTSADSVFQIACHEDVVPVSELYKMCQVAREILSGEHGVARVIARPFVGEKGRFVRTERRRDFSLAPPEDTILDLLEKKGFEVVGIGKINDLFGGRGLTEVVHTKNNMDGMDKLMKVMNKNMKGLIFINLIDFDMLWGHRNNYKGFALGLEEFDKRIPELLDEMKKDDILIITADHGCDPTTPSTDHSREYVPLLVYGSSLKRGVNLGTRETFSDVAKTLDDIFNLDGIKNGKSFFKDISGGF